MSSFAHRHATHGISASRRSCRLAAIALGVFLASLSAIRAEDSPLPGLEPEAPDPAPSPGAIPVQPFAVDGLKVEALPVPGEPPPKVPDNRSIEEELENPLFKDPTADAEVTPIDKAAIRALAAKYLIQEPLVGPFGLTGPFVGFRSGMVVSGFYDSNILQTSSANSEELYGKGPESFTMTAGPFVRYMSPGPLWYLSAAYSPSYVDYVDFSEFSGWDHNGTLGLRYERREWQAEMSGYYRTIRSANSTLANTSQELSSNSATNYQSSAALDREGASGEDYGGKLRMGFNGRKLQATLSGGYARSSGQNRYYSSDVDEERADLQMALGYKLSAKTSVLLDGGIQYRGPIDDGTVVEDSPEEEEVVPPAPVVTTPAVTTPGVTPAPVVQTTPVVPAAADEEEEEPAPSFEETVTARIQFSALWKATPLLELGPGVRATYDARGTELSSSSIGPLLRARYELSKRVKLNAQVAAEFHQFDSEEKPVEEVVEPEPVVVPPAPVVAPPVTTPPGTTPIPAPVPVPVVVVPPAPVIEPEPDPTYDDGDSPFISAELGLNWTPSEAWSVQLQAARSSRVSPNANEDFQEVLSARGSVTRRFDHGIITLGAGYEMENPMREQTNGTGLTERQYLTADLSYSFPVWKDRAFATAFLRYRDQQYGDTINSWDGYQAGIAVGVRF